jgi:phosphate transport system protein
MEHHFDHELGGLRQKLLQMGSLAEAAVKEAVDAVLARNDDLAESARERERIVDRLEIEVDDLAIDLLAKAPLASDLRLVTVAMKISQNLERVGDEAAKIAKRAVALGSEPPLKTTADIAGLARLALDLLKRSLDAFVNRDSTAARALLAEDKQVDALNREVHQNLTEQMLSDSTQIIRALHFMVVAKSLERVGDHAKNIAEETVYLCEAMDIRHAKQKAALKTA